MNKFQLDECLQKQREWYIQHPDSEDLKDLVSKVDYDFEKPLENTETLEYYTVDDLSDEEKDTLYAAYCDIYTKKPKINIDDYFVVMYNQDMQVFPKERLNDFLFMDNVMVCSLKTAKEYKKYNVAYLLSDEQWVREYFDTYEL